MGVTLCELLFSLLAVGGVDLTDKFPDPIRKFISASLDAKGGVTYKELKDGYDS
jgi:hypothetical protein